MPDDRGAGEVAVKHVGNGVWTATLNQDAMEDIAWYLVSAAHRSTAGRRLLALAATFQAALDEAFPDGAQDPTP